MHKPGWRRPAEVALHPSLLILIKPLVRKIGNYTPTGTIGHRIKPDGREKPGPASVFLYF